MIDNTNVGISIDNITLENFRNYRKSEFQFEKINFITGENGRGKTNLLESLYFLSITSSWRTGKDSEVIAWGEEYCRITSGSREFTIQRSPYLKRYKLNGVNQRLQQVMGSLPCVLFQPDDLQIIYGSPSVRRHYLDRLLSQIFPQYALAIANIHHVLKQRNQLLKLINEGAAQGNELDFWDQELENAIAVIQPIREDYVEFLKQNINSYNELLIKDLTGFELSYKKSGLKLDSRFKEVRAGVSLYGPQREDFFINCHDVPAESCLSRGQARALVFGLKLLEIDYLDRHLQVKPILLMDDILSEMDRPRKKLVLDLVGKHQSFITGVEMPVEIKGMNEIKL